MHFYDLYLTLCNKRGVTPSRAATEMGISKVAVTNWKSRGNYPTDANLQKIANYFGVSVEYLKGEPIQKEKPTANSDEALMFALWGGDTEIVDEDMIEDVKDFAKLLAEKKKRKLERKE